MKAEDIDERVAEILSVEKEKKENWGREIKIMSLELIAFLRDASVEVDPEIYKYLDDFDVRLKDDKYAAFQIAKVEGVLSDRKSR